MRKLVRQEFLDKSLFKNIFFLQVWNDELEAIAQRWSDQCTFGHDTTRDKLDGTSVNRI